MSEIRVEGLTHVYASGVRALDGVELRIGPGERLALIGQNGSGKSTLVQHLNGLLRPTHGRILLDGLDSRRRRVADLSALVGLVFQDPDRQIFSASVRAEVEFGPRNLGRRGAELRRSVERALAAVRLTDVAGESPYELGASARKLLAVASVLAMETPVVVLDEPTTGLDLRGIETIRSMLEEIGRERTVIAISHDMEFVASALARIVVMRAGRVVLDGTPEDVFDERSWPTLRSTYIEPPTAARTGARLGVGSTPTDAALIAALVARSSTTQRGAHAAGDQ